MTGGVDMHAQDLVADAGHGTRVFPEVIGEREVVSQGGEGE